MNKQVDARTNTEAIAFISVITHGLFGFVQGDRHLDIITPTIPEHVYAAGTWGSETLLTSGETYILSGVKCGQNSKTKNCVTLSRKKSGITSVDPMKQTYCVIRAPLPKELNVIRALKRVVGDPTLFVGNGAIQNQLDNQIYVPIACELKYDVRDFNSVALGDIWKAATSGDPYLHVWAEPVFLTSPNHAEMAFGMLRDMFEGLDLEINPESDKKLEPEYFPEFKVPADRAGTLQDRCGIGKSRLDFSKIRNCFSALITE
jgi:hypothetical protein